MKRLYWLPIALFAACTASMASCFASSEDGAVIGTGASGPVTDGGAGGKSGKDKGKNNGPASSSAGSGELNGTAGQGGAPGTASGATDSGTTTAGPQCGDTGIPRTFFMSSDDSSSMGSPALAREFLNADKAPPAALIRTYEFLNYYRVRYTVPDDPILDVNANFVSELDGTYHLQVGVQSFKVFRPPMAITFVVDTSGSLVGEGMTRVREAINAIASKLVQHDRVNFVIWANEDAELLADHDVTGPNDPAITSIASNLLPGGGSDLHAGLVHGYDLAQATHSEDRLSRVVLISDGGANLGIVDRDRIAEEAKNGDDQGIYLVGVGVGPAAGYSDTLMDLVTDAGRGSYVYLDSKDEAAKILGDRFEEVMDIAARAVRVQVTLPSYFEIKDFYGEEYSENKEEIEPQHLAPEDSMILNQVLTVCPTCTPCPLDSVEVHVEWNDPSLHESAGPNFTTRTATLGELTGAPFQYLKANAVIRYAEALKSRKKADFMTAQTAVSDAMKDPAYDAVKDFGELESISALLAKFPETEKVD